LKISGDEKEEMKEKKKKFGGEKFDLEISGDEKEELEEKNKKIGAAAFDPEISGDEKEEMKEKNKKIGGAKFDPETSGDEKEELEEKNKKIDGVAFDLKISGDEKNTKKEKNKGGAGLNKERITLTVDTFKKFCMKAGTKKSDEIHTYYIKLEKLLHKTLQEQTQELQLQLENKQKETQEQQTRIKYLENKYLHQQSRIQYPKVFLIYIVTTIENKNKRTYIFGKTTNFTDRLSTYNKTCIHEVIYYKECVSETVLYFVESVLFLRLAQYREKLACERFILPEDRDISFFIEEVDTVVDFFKNVKPHDRAVLTTDYGNRINRDNSTQTESVCVQNEYDKLKKTESRSSYSIQTNITQNEFNSNETFSRPSTTLETQKNILRELLKKQQKIQHNNKYPESYKKYRREYYIKNKTNINQKNKLYRHKNLSHVKNIEKMSRIRNRYKELIRKKIYRLKNKEKIKNYILKNKDKNNLKSKENYLKNRDKKLAYSKEYNKKHSQEKKEYLKKYRQENKDKIKEKKSEKIICDCGVEHTKSSKANHVASKRHIEYLKTLDNVSTDLLVKLESKNKKIQNRPHNREKSKEKRSEKVICECGIEISSGGLTRHKKTERHLKIISSILK